MRFRKKAVAVEATQFNGRMIEYYLRCASSSRKEGQLGKALAQYKLALKYLVEVIALTARIDDREESRKEPK